MKVKKLMNGLMTAALAITIAVSPVTSIYAQEVTVTSGSSTYTFSEMPVAAFAVTGLNLYERHSENIVGLTPSTDTFILYCLPSEKKQGDVWVQSQPGNSAWKGNLYHNSDFYENGTQNNPNGHFELRRSQNESAPGTLFFYTDSPTGNYGSVEDAANAQISFVEISHTDAPQSDVIYVIATDGCEECLAAIPQALQAAGATVVQIPVADALAGNDAAISQLAAQAQEEARAEPPAAAQAQAEAQAAAQAQAEAQAAAQAQAEAQAAAQAQAEAQAQVQTQTVKNTTNTASGTYTVEHGDNLCKIATKVYGDPKAWKAIYDANSATIRNNYMIFTGQILVIPER